MIMLPKKLQKESGQALLIVLLSMAVILTVVLSILSRSILDVAVSTGEEEALRAFSAAEAGIERGLIIGTDIPTTQLGDAEFSANISGFAENLTEFVHPIKLLSGESNVVWFVSHDADGNMDCSIPDSCFKGDRIKICWGNKGTSGSSATTPAIEVSVFYLDIPGDYSTTKIARAVFDPNGSRATPNNFASSDAGSCTLSGKELAFQKTFDLSSLGIPGGTLSTENGLQYARVRMFYNTAQTHSIGVDVNFPGNNSLPSQGSLIESLGSAGNSNRRIEVFKSFGEPPSIF